jgi:hypothetical protein
MRFIQLGKIGGRDIPTFIFITNNLLRHNTGYTGVGNKYKSTLITARYEKKDIQVTYLLT